MKDQVGSKPISVRGMIKNWQQKLVPIEDDVQYAEAFHIFYDEDVLKEETMETTIAKLADIVESDGTLTGAKEKDDYKQAVRSRFDKSSADVIVESVVGLVIERNLAN